MTTITWNITASQSGQSVAFSGSATPEELGISLGVDIGAQIAAVTAEMAGQPGLEQAVQNILDNAKSMPNAASAITAAVFRRIQDQYPNRKFAVARDDTDADSDTILLNPSTVRVRKDVLGADTTYALTGTVVYG